MQKRVMVATILIIGLGLGATAVFLIWRSEKGKVAPSPPPKDSEGYYGYSTFGSCQTDADCTLGGCNSEICQSRDEDPINSICTLPSEPLPDALGYQCRCVDKMCQWAK